MFDEYVGQLQMATIASIQVEHGGIREMSRKEISDKLKPLQQVRKNLPCLAGMSLLSTLAAFHQRTWGALIDISASGRISDSNGCGSLCQSA